jgi:hypothetical protein
MEVRLSIYFVPVDATEHSMGDSNQPVVQGHAMVKCTLSLTKKGEGKIDQR